MLLAQNILAEASWFNSLPHYCEPIPMCKGTRSDEKKAKGRKISSPRLLQSKDMQDLIIVVSIFFSIIPIVWFFLGGGGAFSGLGCGKFGAQGLRGQEVTVQG